jgi:hypothetical protein
MKKKDMTLKRLARLLNRCVDEGVAITFLTNPDQPPPSWEDTCHIAMDAYLQALVDVLEAVEGDPSDLEELFSEGGKAVLLDPERKHPFVRVPKEDVKAAKESGFLTE